MYKQETWGYFLIFGFLYLHHSFFYLLHALPNGECFLSNGDNLQYGITDILSYELKETVPVYFPRLWFIVLDLLWWASRIIWSATYFLSFYHFVEFYCFRNLYSAVRASKLSSSIIMIGSNDSCETVLLCKFRFQKHMTTCAQLFLTLSKSLICYEV